MIDEAESGVKLESTWVTPAARAHALVCADPEGSLDAGPAPNPAVQPVALTWSEYVADLQARGAAAESDHGLWCPADCPCGFTVPEEALEGNELLGLARTLLDPQVAAMFLAADDADAMLYGPGALHRFLRGAWHEVEPGVVFEDGPAIEAICDHLQTQLEERAFALGLDPQPPSFRRMRAQNLLIRIPPRSLKTVIATIVATAWAWLRWPTMTILTLSSNPRVTSEAADKFRSLVRSGWYQQTFRPQWRVREDMDALAKIGNTAGGWRAARGMTSRITGEGADWLLVDDPHDGAEVFSKAKREAVNAKWDRSIKNRHRDPRFTIRTGIMQALYHEDWGQKRIAEGWGLLLIRMCYEPARPRKKVGEHWVETDDKRVSPYGWRDWRTTPGEPIAPRFTPEFIAAEMLVPLIWAAQYQQDPAPADGGMIKYDDVGTYEDPPERTGRWAVTVDAAFKAKPDGSRVSVQCWCEAATGPNKFLVDNDTRPMHLEQTIEAVKAMLEKYPRARGCVLVEDKANGSEIIRRLKEEIPGVIAVNPGSNSKEGRLMACLAYFYGGCVFVPKHARWRDDLMAEWTQFPNWPTDDQVDAAVQLLLHWRVSTSARGALAQASI